MVDGPPDDRQLRMLDAGPRDLYKKRYNVAVSRARNQLWIVHSLDMNRHLKAGDLRRLLLAHAHDPEALLREMEIQGNRVRIRGSVFFRNPDAAVAPVFAKLGDLEIEALGPASHSERRADSPLVDRIRRSAEAVRARWLAEETSTTEVEEEEFAPL
jgi:hypothetical protein